MISTTTIQNVPLTTRDVQWLALVDVMVATLLDRNADPEHVDMNLDAIALFYHHYYSHTEANALRDKLRALLPPDAPLTFVQPQLFAASNASLLS